MEFNIRDMMASFSEEETDFSQMENLYGNLAQVLILWVSSNLILINAIISHLEKI